MKPAPGRSLACMVTALFPQTLQSVRTHDPFPKNSCMELGLHTEDVRRLRIAQQEVVAKGGIIREGILTAINKLRFSFIMLHVGPICWNCWADRDDMFLNRDVPYAGAPIIHPIRRPICRKDRDGGHNLIVDRCIQSFVL